MHNLGIMGIRLLMPRIELIPRRAQLKTSNTHTRKGIDRTGTSQNRATGEQTYCPYFQPKLGGRSTILYSLTSVGNSAFPPSI